MQQKARYILVLIMLSCLGSYAQNPLESPLGRFEVDVLRGCAPLTVNVTNISGNNTDQYFYDVDTCVVGSPKYDPTLCPQTSATTNTTFTYTQPGTYSLVQVLSTGVPRTDTLVIEVFDAQTPQFELRLCDNYQVQVIINDTFYDRFLIDYGDGTAPTSSLTHTYPAMTATYPVTVSGYFSLGAINCADSTINISPVNNIPTSNIALLQTGSVDASNGTISLDYILNTQVDYMLEIYENAVLKQTLSAHTRFGIFFDCGGRWPPQSLPVT